MKKDDILVVKCNVFLKQDKYKDLYQSILEQKINGVVILPAYCDAVIVPKDTEIKVEPDSDQPNHTCINCKYGDDIASDDPCYRCMEKSLWEPKDDLK